MGDVLTKSEIQHFGVIVEPDPKSLQPTSYDLRLGHCHYIFDRKDGTENSWRPVFLGNSAELEEKNRTLPNYETPLNSKTKLTIPPYGSAIIELLELVDTYTPAMNYNKLIVGRFDLKLSKVYQALISQQATQVEPFYRGRLYCFVHNLSNKSVELELENRIATIEFSYAGEHLSDEERRELIQESAESAISKYQNEEYSTEKGIDEVRWFYSSSTLPADCGLNRLYDSVEQKGNNLESSLEQKFFEYVSKEDTISKLASRVDNKSADKHRNLEFLFAAITSLMSLGVASIIWEFYRELADIVAVLNLGAPHSIIQIQQFNPLLLLIVFFLIMTPIFIAGFFIGKAYRRRRD